ISGAVHQQEFLQELGNNQKMEEMNIGVLSNQNVEGVCETLVDENTGLTKDQQERAIKIYDAYRDDLRKRQLSNTENYDKTILTLSSSALALSLTAIRIIIPLKSANCLFIIQWCWWLFGVTIAISIIAYWVSNKALDKQLEIAEDYYSNGNNDAFSRKNWYSITNNWLNISTGFTFLVATAFLIYFVTLNIHGEFEMSDKKYIVLDSASVTKMQSINQVSREKFSATVPAMQLAPIKPIAQQQTTQSSGNNNNEKK
ncbi:hypothetical protein A1353_09480, partial [Methylomonas methanica]